jgi:hypothetical protein
LAKADVRLSTNGTRWEIELKFTHRVFSLGNKARFLKDSVPELAKFDLSYLV